MNRIDFERLQALERTYEASLETKRLLGKKVLVEVLGPTGVGKSTVIHKAIEFQTDQNVASWGEPGSIVTRNRRADDPASYRTADEGIRAEDLAKRIYNGSLTNYSLHPSGAMYATDAESFKYDYNLMPTMPSSVDQLNRAGFEKTFAAFITVEPADLKAGLRDRIGHPSFEARVREGINNIDFALDHKDTIRFIRNSHAPGGLEMAADDLIALSLDNYVIDDTPELRVVQAMRKCLHGYVS